MYCERNTDSSEWNQPKLPFHNQSDPEKNISGNLTSPATTNVYIHDCQTSQSKLIVSEIGHFIDGSTGTLIIPANYCIYCGRKLGK
jgi:hypothetical protein